MEGAEGAQADVAKVEAVGSGVTERSGPPKGLQLWGGARAPEAQGTSEGAGHAQGSRPFPGI